MFSILESKESINKLLNKGYKKVFVQIITSSDNYHPKLSKLIGLYIRPFNTQKGYIVSIDHPDGSKIDLDYLKEILSSFDEIYVLDKKKFLYYLNLKNLVDINFLLVLNGKPLIESPSFPSTYNWFYNKNYTYKDVNKLIPLLIHFKYCEDLFSKIEKVVEVVKDESFDFYNNLVTNIFFLLEQEGLKIKVEDFKKAYKVEYPEFNILDNKIYTYYNLYNITSRPTNSFNSINFAAIPHKPENRECIIPDNDYFIEFDFDGYHLRLLSELLDTPLLSESAHKQIAKQYYNKEEITEEEYKHVKQLNFQAIYGKIPEDYLHINLFKLAKQYVESLWKEYSDNGYVKAPISNKRFFNTLEEMHPQKLMNYIIQSLETSKNVLILKELLNLLKDKESKIVLYTYDSLLLDYSKEDGKELLYTIEKTLNQENKFPIHYKISNNLVL